MSKIDDLWYYHEPYKKWYFLGDNPKTSGVNIGFETPQLFDSSITSYDDVPKDDVLQGSYFKEKSYAVDDKIELRLASSLFNSPGGWPNLIIGIKGVGLVNDGSPRTAEPENYIAEANFKDGEDRSLLFQKIYSNYILPYYNKAYTEDTTTSTEVKAITKAWIEDSTNFPLMQKRLGMIANSDGPINTSGNDINLTGRVQISPESFFEALFEAKREGNVLEGLGFDEKLRDLADGVGFGGIAGGFSFGFAMEKPTVAALERALADPTRSNRQEALDLVREAAGLGEPTEEQRLDFRQCALTTALLFDMNFDGTNTSVSRYFQNPSSKSPLYSADYGDINHVNYRIYPVVPDASIFDPNNLVNICTVSKNIKETMISIPDVDGDVFIHKPSEIYRKLYWVYSDPEGSLREVAIPLSSNAVTEEKKKDISKLRIAQRYLVAGQTEKAQTTLGTTGSISLGDVQRDLRDKRSELLTESLATNNGYYYLENATIKYDGTNPSTARNDVQVELSFFLSNMSQLNTVIIRGEETTNELHSTVKFRLMDLITLPATKTTETETEDGGFLPNQYSPKYSRIRLKVKANGDDESNLFLDLATIDHTISRTSDTGDVKLTINYRGYFEATLNMPYNDALATIETIEDREAVTEAMNKLAYGEAKCKPETIRQAMRMQQELLSRQNRDASASSFIYKLFGINCIHTYTLKETKMTSLDFYVNPEENHVEKIMYSFTGSVLEETDKLEETIRNKDSTEDERREAREALSNKFFFLGDLMAVASDCLYVNSPRNATHPERLKGLDLRFIVGTVYVPNPNDLNGPPLVINPCSIPIDISFFVEWFNSSVAKKGLHYYPVGTFIRDLIERVVNGVIYDTCFSLTLPDENPPILRSQTFTTTREKWFKKQNLSFYYREGDEYEDGTNATGFFIPNDPYAAGYADTDLNLLMEKNLNTETTGGKINSKQYCVIYQQFPSFFRQLKRGGGKAIKENPYVPTIFYGQGNTKFNFISDVSFSKTNSPGLREARYFNSNYGSLSLLSNVYDLDFSFNGRVGNTLFYPGVIINFILLDWDTNSYDSEHPSTFVINNDYSHFGQSNPHKQGTMANIMGMGGYFIVKSVEYTLGESFEDFKIKISTKFLGNDGNNPPGRPSEEPKNITDSKDCVDAIGEIVTRVNENFKEGDKVFSTPGVEEPTVQEGQTDGEESQRESEVTVPDAPVTEGGSSEILEYFKSREGGSFNYYDILPEGVTLNDLNRETNPYKALKNKYENKEDIPKGTVYLQSASSLKNYMQITVGSDGFKIIQKKATKR